ncbi:RAD50 interactor 1 [Rhynchophorus ferrugineus]|uniref:RAD50 interactor 1 n=1 Tax=Rhynchophorus ferrugineus TaxID=354439 RepID=UPI003FCEA9B7
MLSDQEKQKVLQDINIRHGKNLLNLEKCNEFYNNLLSRKDEILKELQLSNTGSVIGKSIENANVILSQSKESINQSNKLINIVERDLSEFDEIRTNLKSKLDKLHTLQTTLQYMRVFQQIEFLCLELQLELDKNDDEKCITHFANLTEISRILADSTVFNLKWYLKEIILHWYNILKNKLSGKLDEVLQQIKWPFVTTNFSLVAPIGSNVNKLQTLAEYLLQIEIPPESNILVEVSSGVLGNFEPICLPVHFLIQPLKKRFIYHFYGSRKTNRADKPEWYFTQILTWIRDHKEHVGLWIQPVIEKFGLHHIDAQVEFMKGLVHLAAEKLNSELPSLQYDDYTFSHTIDEALGFDKEMREIYNYPANEPSIISILTQAPILVKWLIMEKKYAIEKMDAILSPCSVEAFELLASDVEDLKITTCADAFITLLQTITSRYEGLPQPGHRLQFLELQLELLDDFRVRLLQLVNAEEGDVMESKIPSIANTLYYIENVLVDWGSMLHFLNLHYYKQRLEDTKQPPASPTSNDFDDSLVLDLESDSIFIETLSLYRHFRQDLLCMLAERVLGEIKKRSRDYRQEKWSSITVQKEFKSLSLTPTACPIFEVLAKRMHQLQKSLQNRLFTIVWRNIAAQLDTFLFDDLIMDNRFNDGGALQLKFDITRNLLPLFSQYTETPANYFTQIIESCNLLTLTKGSALLLRETLLALEGATGVEDTRGKTLKEIGVNNFTPKMAVKILNQRADITLKRLEID